MIYHLLFLLPVLSFVPAGAVSPHPVDPDYETDTLIYSAKLNIFGAGFQMLEDKKITKSLDDVKNICVPRCQQNASCTGFGFRIDERYDGRTNGNCWLMTGDFKYSEGIENSGGGVFVKGEAGARPDYQAGTFIYNGGGLFGAGFQMLEDKKITKSLDDVKNICVPRCQQNASCTGFGFRIDERYDGRTNGNCWLMTGDLKYGTIRGGVYVKKSEEAEQSCAENGQCLPGSPESFKWHLSSLFVSRGISKEALEDPSSPQYKALDWMATIDSTDPDRATLSEDEVVERFVLVVLYYATGGGVAWKGERFLFPSLKTCDWQIIGWPDRSSGGFHCNGKGSILTLDLSKFPNSSTC
jgi:hypothetical protein